MLLNAYYIWVPCYDSNMVHPLNRAVVNSPSHAWKVIRQGYSSVVKDAVDKLLNHAVQHLFLDFTSEEEIPYGIDSIYLKEPCFCGIFS